MIINGIGGNSSLSQNLESEKRFFKENSINNFVKKFFFNTISCFFKTPKDTLKCINAKSENKDNFEMSSLLKAIKDNDLKTVKTLLKTEKDLNLNESLLLALKNKHISIVKYLLENFKEKINLDYALLCKIMELNTLELLLIIEKKPKIPKNLSEAVKAGNVEMVEKFLEEGNTDQREINKLFMEYQPIRMLSNEKGSKIYQLLWAYRDNISPNNQ